MQPHALIRCSWGASAVKNGKQKFFTCLFLLALAATAVYGAFSAREDTAALMNVSWSSHTVILDAGHGGEDGGAISLSGATESGINLAIAKKLDGIFGLYGVQTVMLRTEDVSLHSEGASTLREKKSSDLQNRVARISSFEDATLISIHQNSYTGGAQYHGAQVFYANGELSRPLAERTQNVLRETLDPSNQRTVAPVPSGVYLMNHVSCQAILVECGFLSNPEEDRLLQESGNQRKVAAALAGAYLQDRCAISTEEEGA